MKKYTYILAAVLALGISIAAPLAFAQKASRRGYGFGSAFTFGRIEQAKRVLDLSDAQVTEIQTIFRDLQTQNAPYRQSIHTGMQSAILGLINNPNDIAGAQALIDQQTEAERTLKTNVLNAASKALNVLTAEQRAKLATLVQERMAKRHSR